MLLQLKSVLVGLLCLLKPPSLSSSANCNSKQMQTLPTALNQAATTGMLTGPGFGLRALAAHSSGTDNGRFCLEVFVAAVLCVSPDSRFHYRLFTQQIEGEVDAESGWCAVAATSLLLFSADSKGHLLSAVPSCTCCMSLLSVSLGTFRH